jgi:hypothetical protein
MIKGTETMINARLNNKSFTFTCRRAVREVAVLGCMWEWFVERILKVGV